MRDPKIDPREGDVLVNCSRTVIRRMPDKIIFGIERGGSMNSGAYTCTIDEWQKWAESSCYQDKDWR